jgi:hypothetical protein
MCDLIICNHISQIPINSIRVEQKEFFKGKLINSSFQRKGEKKYLAEVIVWHADALAPCAFSELCH